MTPDIKGLVKRLRSNEVAALPGHIQAFVSAAADAIEALAGEVERWKKNHEALQDKIGCMKSCGCAYDAAGDICGHHSPKLIAAEAERDRLAGEVEQWRAAFNKLQERALTKEQALADCTAERDRLKAALEAIVKAQYSGGAKTAIARKALGDAT